MTAGAIPTVSEESQSATTDDVSTSAEDEVLVEEDLLIEEVSIDGMCGVY